MGDKQNSERVEMVAPSHGACKWGGGMLLVFPFSWHGWQLGLIQCDDYRIALIMGLTYKENVPDTRESPVVRIIEELKEFGVEIYGDDPLLSTEEIEEF